MAYEGYNKQIFAVVDAYSTGYLLGPAIRARGAAVLHVKNSIFAPESHVSTFNSNDYSCSIEYSDDINYVINVLSNLGVRHILSGGESGTELAERLAVEMKLTTANSPGYSDARRNKRIMHRVLDDKGINIPWQRHINSNLQVDWQTNGVQPTKVVVKPVESAGTDSVYICDTELQTLEAVNKIFKKNNVFGLPNYGVVIQQYLEGPEYMVNTVSVDGLHSAVEIWKSEKKLIDNNPIYDRQIIEDPNDSQILTIISYVFDVLTALGVRWGIAHTEVILTPEGPLLLESATRLPGGLDPSLGNLITGRSLIDETLDAYLYPDQVQSKGSTRKILKYSIGVSLITPKSGILIDHIDLNDVTSLSSYHGVKFSPKIGEHVPKTTDLFTKPGGVYLCHESRTQLMEDYERIREWELHEFDLKIR